MSTSHKLCIKDTHDKLVIFVIFANAHMANFTLHMSHMVKLFVSFDCYIKLQCSVYSYFDFYIQYYSFVCQLSRLTLPPFKHPVHSDNLV